MTGSGLEMGDGSMLDLFRMETNTQAVALNQNLTALRNEPTSDVELGFLSWTARAIKGAARLVELDAIANLAQALEACFDTTRQTNVALGAEQLTVLLRGVDFLLRLSYVENAGFDRWLVTNQDEIEASTAAIAALIPNTSPDLETKQQPDISPQPATLNHINTAIPCESETIANTEDNIAENAVENADMGTDLSNRSMLDLFRLEVEAQVTLLNEGLLALENQPQSAQDLESLMRAAHSIKGAARIVALEAAVNLAHVMEDCFVAAQNQAITLDGNGIDLLLQGVDLFSMLSQVEETALTSWLSQHQPDILATQQQIAALFSPNTPTARPDGTLPSAPALPAAGNPVSLPVEPSATILSSPNNINASPTPHETATTSQLVKTSPGNLESASQSSGQASPSQARVVRVSAENLNRIMGLAGESLIEATWLQPFADSLTALKTRQAELSKVLENLQAALAGSQVSEASKQYLDAARRKEQECVEILADRLHELELFARRTGNLSDRLYREVIASHMRPFADGVQGFPRMIRDLARKLNKQVKLEILGKSTPVDRDILKKLEAPLTHILRNSVDHGIELPDERRATAKSAEGTIRLAAFHRGGMLAITISDDGKGIDPERLRQKAIRKNLIAADMATQLTDSELLEFLFLPGFSTAKQVTEISGRGVGLDIARSMAQDVGGTVRVQSQLGKGTSFHFQLPLTLSVTRTLLVEISSEPYAFPLARIEQILMVEQEAISVVENRQYFSMDDKNIGLVAAYQVLELPAPDFRPGALPVVVISDQTNCYGLVVDRFLGERDLVVRPLDPRLGKVQDIGAAALMGDGSPILIVDVSDLVQSIDNLLNSRRLNRLAIADSHLLADSRKSILVVDDSITVREMERKLLENRGYRVEIAVNGVDAWNAIRTSRYDLVISDIDMPRMDGIELVKRLKNHPTLHSIPVIIVSYKDRESDRIQGLEAGADYYLTKSSFQDDTLVNAVLDLIGSSS